MKNRSLDNVFGVESRGDSPLARARTSNLVFVRSQDHLSLAKPTATGRKLTAVEALDAYGLETLQEVMDYGSAVLPVSEGEPGITLKSRRLALGLTINDVSRVTGLPAAHVEECEIS